MIGYGPPATEAHVAAPVEVTDGIPDSVVAAVSPRYAPVTPGARLLIV